MLNLHNYLFSLIGINCWNPSFDVTPAELITGGLITELGLFKPGELLKLKEILVDRK